MKLAPVSKDGSYEALLTRAGRYALSVEQSKGVAGDQNSLEYFVEVPDQEEFRYDLELPTGQISGRITRADGTPASQTRVTLDVEGAVDSASFMGSHFYERQADAKGQYSVTGLRPGTYRIAVGGMPLGGFLSDSAVHGRLVQSKITLAAGEPRKDVNF
ncbi:MAG: carboxypeptidase-like regulatory domain-containing protein, partial [Planctomycetota bacterium]